MLLFLLNFWSHKCSLGEYKKIRDFFQKHKWSYQPKIKYIYILYSGGQND